MKLIPRMFSRKKSKEEMVKNEFKTFLDMAEKSEKRFDLRWEDRLVFVDDKTSTPGFGEYFYHIGWAARKLELLRPEVHYDISSHSYFISVLSAFMNVRYYEYRHVPVNLSGLDTGSADLCNLPFECGSINSLSCMHTVEHIGLGRYGDQLDYDGDIKAMEELKRVVAPEGSLLFVVPLGSPARIEFNAHRVYDLHYILVFFIPEFSLEEFSSVIEENGICILQRNASPTIVEKLPYALGCFHFHRKKIL